MFPVDYRVPRTLRARVRGKRVAIVNDVINAGSTLPNNLWTPAECPLCVRLVPLASGLGPDPIREPTT